MSTSAAARFRYTVVAGATAVVIGTGFTLVGLNKHAAAEAQTQIPQARDAVLAATSPVSLLPTSSSPQPEASSSPSASASPRPSSKSPVAKRTTTRPAATKTTTKEPSVTAAAAGDDSVISLVLAHINAARADAGLKPLTLDANLSKASALHNELMINGCGLEHQCSGESGIGDRFSAQGVSWSSAGENIGFGSSGASDAAITQAANGLTDSMLAEQPPNDGHRKNLLNTGYKHIGLSVVRDSKGITWMTQDFVG